VDDLLIRYDAAHYEIQPQQLDAFLNRLESAHADIPPSHCMAFGEWEQALARGDFEQARALKTQLVGLITLAFAIRYQGKAFAYDLMLTEALGRHLYRLAMWQIERLEQWGLPVILFFDEPCLVFT